ncbi:ATP-binding protein [Streptomyces sp. NA02950]|uniref:ATP-binding protein n=1 Tax=Streptomyces sp. NA02950 TaxID=2742137 RepID=UPI001591D76F|nr:ATP-binding protein [Streptomyces sp. NA02950]QKV91848.1 ATP-binding protein [Streptomyces sp. NA02950]
MSVAHELNEAMTTVSADLRTGPDAAVRARRVARGFLGKAALNGAAEMCDAVELVVSELVTNVVRHTDGRVCRVELTDVGDGLEIAVTDSDPRPPRWRSPDLSGGGGFGWPLVHRLASSVRVSTRPTGKTVHALLTPGLVPA